MSTLSAISPAASAIRRHRKWLSLSHYKSVEFQQPIWHQCWRTNACSSILTGSEVSFGASHLEGLMFSTIPLLDLGTSE